MKATVMLLVSVVVTILAKLGAVDLVFRLDHWDHGPSLATSRIAVVSLAFGFQIVIGMGLALLTSGNLRRALLVIVISEMAYAAVRYSSEGLPLSLHSDFLGLSLLAALNALLVIAGYAFVVFYLGFHRN
jgi:hypothetical protein